MSEADLQATETEPADPYADLPPFEEEVQEPAAETESTEPVEPNAEEAAETEEGTETSPEPEPARPDLSAIPEEHHDAARMYADSRVSDLQRSWQEKLDAAAQAKKDAEELASYKEIVENFDARLKADPAGLIRDLQEMAPAEPSGPPPPEDPGPMPVDEYGDLDTKSLPVWIEKRDAYRDYQAEQKIAAVQEATLQQVQPAMQQAEAAQAAQRTAGIRSELKVTDEEWTAMQEVGARLQQEGQGAGWAVIRDNVRLQKELADLKGKKTEHAKQVVGGSEQGPGLPRTRENTPKPKPTGDLTKDIATELEQEGVAWDEADG
jgi:hypothetical protein